MRAGEKIRLDGMAQIGYCASMKKYYYGVREHIIFTRGGRISHIEHVAGNRHDVQGLYALLKSSFRGVLIGDCAYQPNVIKKEELREKGIYMIAAQRSNTRRPRSREFNEWLHRNRAQIERWIGLFDHQFSADRTFNRSWRHYVARRWTKALAHNCSRHINECHRFAFESTAHFRAAS
ncbi:MAG: transposase [Planctomycetota bacterium]|nr:transposase [Planctomycetota bacterium]